MKTTPSLRFLGILFVLAGSLLAKEPPACEVIISVDLTDEGKKVEPPTKEKPVYYLPIVGGYREEGNTSANEIKPDQREILHDLAKALAKQHYFVVGKDTQPPSLLLTFHWGYIDPTGIANVDPTDDTPPGTTMSPKDRQKMNALVAGKTVNDLEPRFDHKLVEAINEDRYFVIVVAYDMAAAQKHEKKILWIARMSTSRTGVTLSDVAGALITAGAPHFGRETKRPSVEMTPLTPNGTVETGPLETKELIDKPASPTSNQPENQKP